MPFSPWMRSPLNIPWRERWCKYTIFLIADTTDGKSGVFVIGVFRHIALVIS